MKIRPNKKSLVSITSYQHETPNKNHRILRSAGRRLDGLDGKLRGDGHGGRRRQGGLRLRQGAAAARRRWGFPWPWYPKKRVSFLKGTCLFKMDDKWEYPQNYGTPHII